MWINAVARHYELKKKKKKIFFARGDWRESMREFTLG